MSKKTKFENFEIEVVNRKQLKNAPYNPRVISEEARKRLKRGIKKFGLVEPIVWNRRTGNIISGHQRIAILDELEGTNDYELQVAVVDVDEKTEKKLNIQLNNTSMMGDFDLDKLGDLILELGEPEDLGFSMSDLAIMFEGDERFTDMFYSDPQEVKDAKDILREIKQNREEMMEKYKQEQTADFYFVVVCRDANEKKEVLNMLGIPEYEQYISADILKRLKRGDNDGKAKIKQKTD